MTPLLEGGAVEGDGQASRLQSCSCERSWRRTPRHDLIVRLLAVTRGWTSESDFVTTSYFAPVAQVDRAQDS